MSNFNLNKCMFLGRLGAAVTLRYTGQGTAVANFPLGVNRPKLPNQQKQMCDWVKVVIFGKAAETAAEHLTKGRRVYVEGQLQVRNYEDQNGNTRYITEVISNSFSFVDAPNKNNGNGDDLPTTENKDNNDEMLDDLPDEF